MLLEGIVGVQKEAVLAAKRSIVTVEEVVEDFGPRSPNAVILPAWTITAIAVVPGGAFPSYAHGYYKRANAFYKAWDAIARDRDTFRKWMDENVMGKTAEDFAQYASGPHSDPPPAGRGAECASAMLSRSRWTAPGCGMFTKGPSPTPPRKGEGSASPR